MRLKIIIGIVLASALGGVGFWALNRNSDAPVDSTNQAILGSYLALGDSVAAGVGLQNPKDASACDRTANAYPAILAKERQLNLIDRSCSGASLASGILGSQTVNQLVTPPQLGALTDTKDLQLITLTAGANDLAWTTLLTQCLIAACDTPKNTALVTSRILALEPLLNQTLEQLQASAKTRTVVTGYYLLFDETTNPCTNTEGITASEQRWIRTMQLDLNETIKNAVSRHPNVRYVAPDFSGHALCASDSYIQSINDPQPYHPTARGQEIIAETIQKTITEQ